MQSSLSLNHVKSLMNKQEMQAFLLIHVQASIIIINFSQRTSLPALLVSLHVQLISSYSRHVHVVNHTWPTTRHSQKLGKLLQVSENLN